MTENIIFINGIFIDNLKQIMKNQLFTYKKIFLSLFSLVVFFVFLGLVQKTECSCNLLNNVNIDKNQASSEFFNIEANSVLNSINHKLNNKNNKNNFSPETTNAVFSVKSSKVIKSALVKFAVNKQEFNLYLTRNINFKENYLPEIQTEKALRSDILLI